ncbi:MAG: hypothetical protein GPJ09_20085 [Microcystis aeruginosa SX13-01]|nr:hypothetical protein [Microcystis aeruginosa SX13-01]NCR68134.1 hypothetical protein [Microcystis aeruginosa LL11-07]
MSVCKEIALSQNNRSFRVWTIRIALSKAKGIAVLKFNQQQDDDRTLKSQSDRSFKV